MKKLENVDVNDAAQMKLTEYFDSMVCLSNANKTFVEF